MLSMNRYGQDYVDYCRSRIALQVSACEELVAAARDLAPTGEARLDSAIKAFEPMFGFLLLSGGFFAEIESKYGA